MMKGEKSNLLFVDVLMKKCMDIADGKKYMDIIWRDGV